MGSFISKEDLLQIENSLLKRKNKKYEYLYNTTLVIFYLILFMVLFILPYKLLSYNL